MSLTTVVGDMLERMLVTHILNHFPHQHSVNLKKPCPVDQTGIILPRVYS